LLADAFTQLNKNVIPLEILLANPYPTELSKSSYSLVIYDLSLAIRITQRDPSFFKQISFPDSFVISATGTVNHGFDAELCLG
jgi:hypothetical protein